jgi:hypothetical protein
VRTGGTYGRGPNTTRWFTFAVAFALMPLVTTCILRYLKDAFTWNEVARSPDVLFFSVMICATALGDIVDAKARFEAYQPWPPTVALLSIGAVLTAVLYGALVFDTLDANGMTLSHLKLLQVSAALACACLALGTAVQINIGLAELRELAKRPMARGGRR